MLDPKKELKKYVAAFFLLLVFAASISGLRIQSVKQYNEEQKRLAEDIIIADTDTGAAVLVEGEHTKAGSLQGTGGIGEASASGKNSDSSAAEKPATAVPKAVRQGNAPDVPPYPQETGTRDAESKTAKNKQNRRDSRNSKKPDASLKKPSVSSGQKRDDAAEREEAQKYPAKSPAAKTKATQKPSPLPSEEKKHFVCGIVIRCDSMLKHMDDVDDAVKNYIPADGLILGQTEVKVETGDTAYSLLQKVCQAKEIALDATYTNAYASAYVRGIGHIYEKQAGLSSGWLYLVNGKLPGYGASRYRLKEGDRIEWIYSCTGRLE